MGRTGRLFAYEHSGVEPDILTAAKALAGGLPMGAMLAREAVAASFVPGTHASTFGGTPFVSAVAVAVVETMLQDDLPGNAARMGKYLLDRLTDLRGRRPAVLGARGKGLLVGVDLSVPARSVVNACMARGLLVITAGDTVLRCAPPLIATEADVDRAVGILDAALGEVCP
jgi:acetylornithine/succinyldiaminopimelate/putrescine aminotransferase